MTRRNWLKLTVGQLRETRERERGKEMVKQNVHCCEEVCVVLTREVKVGVSMGGADVHHQLVDALPL